MNGFGTALTDMLAVGSLIGLAASLALFAIVIVSRTPWARVALQRIAPWTLPGSFAVSLAGVAGSLYYSEIAGFSPCLLCWWQRIFLYPVVVLTGIALLRRERGIGPYVLALVVPGAGIALYQSFLQWGWFLSSAPCSVSGTSCTFVYFTAFGFVTLPFLSLAAFVTIAALTATLIRSRTLDPTH